MVSLVENLERVRDTVDNGWVKYRSHAVSPSGKDRFCLSAATVEAVPGGGMARYDVHTAITSVLPKRYNGSVVTFNDAKPTKKADVLRVIDKAIARAKKGQ